MFGQSLNILAEFLCFDLTFFVLSFNGHVSPFEVLRPAALVFQDDAFFECNIRQLDAQVKHIKFLAAMHSRANAFRAQRYHQVIAFFDNNVYLFLYHNRIVQVCGYNEIM